MIARLLAALPDWRTAAAGSLLWAVVLAASAAVWLALADRLDSGDWRSILVVFALGGLIAFPSGLYAARLLVPAGTARRRFAAAFLSLGSASALGVAFVFAMQYRRYYAQWHEDFPSIGWLFQLAFTGAGSVYQFAVLGMRMFFPVALIALLAFSIWYARQTR